MQAPIGGGRPAALTLDGAFSTSFEDLESFTSDKSTVGPLTRFSVTGQGMSAPQGPPSARRSSMKAPSYRSEDGDEGEPQQQKPIRRVSVSPSVHAAGGSWQQKQQPQAPSGAPAQMNPVPPPPDDSRRMSLRNSSRRQSFGPQGGGESSRRQSLFGRDNPSRRGSTFSQRHGSIFGDQPKDPYDDPYDDDPYSSVRRGRGGERDFVEEAEPIGKRLTIMQAHITEASGSAFERMVAQLQPLQRVLGEERVDALTDALRGEIDTLARDTARSTSDFAEEQGDAMKKALRAAGEARHSTLERAPSDAPLRASVRCERAHQLPSARAPSPTLTRRACARARVRPSCLGAW
jgi:hypothetical protein